MQLITLMWESMGSRDAYAFCFRRRGGKQFVIPRVRSGSVPGENLNGRVTAACSDLTRDGKEKSPAEESTITIGSDRQVVGAPSAV